MSKIKLPHASGNSMSIGAPATNPASDLEIKLPATIGTANQVLMNSSTPGTLQFGTACQVSTTTSGTLDTQAYELTGLNDPEMVIINAIAISGSADWDYQIYLGTASAYKTSGYVSGSSYIRDGGTDFDDSSAGFRPNGAFGTAIQVRYSTDILTKAGSGEYNWLSTGYVNNDGTLYNTFGGGYVSLGGALTRIKGQLVGGVFDGNSKLSFQVYKSL